MPKKISSNSKRHAKPPFPGPNIQHSDIKVHMRPYAFIISGVGSTKCILINTQFLQESAFDGCKQSIEQISHLFAHPTKPTRIYFLEAGP